METVTSADGTTIAFDRLGTGPPLIMLAGAFNTRSTTAALAAELQGDFSVVNPDRRGRGDSGDIQPYSIQREIEDIEALIHAVGGSAAVFGYSSGANLALLAAAGGAPISKLALYEPPFLVDDSRPPLPADFARQLSELVAAGRRGDAVELYQTTAVGMPEPVVTQLRNAPFRPGLEAIAHTLAYDAEIVGDLTLAPEVAAAVRTPTLVIAGDQSPPLLRNAADALASALAAGRSVVLEGQTHDISPEATAPVLREFL